MEDARQILEIQVIIFYIFPENVSVLIRILIEKYTRYTFIKVTADDYKEQGPQMTMMNLLVKKVPKVLAQHNDY